MRAILAIFLAAGVAAAQSVTNSSPKPLERQVHGQTLTSTANPAVTISFSEEYKYVGGQRWDLYGVADAEQHLFVKPGQDKTVERFYWVQFESYLPNNRHTYNYPADHATKVSGLEFVYDTKIFADFTQLNPKPDSDFAYAQKLLQKNGYTFPKASMGVRLIHLPHPDKRSELMIIYCERMDPRNLPKGGQEVVSADDQAPEVAQGVLKNALRGMQIRRP